MSRLPLPSFKRVVANLSKDDDKAAQRDLFEDSCGRGVTRQDTLVEEGTQPPFDQMALESQMEDSMHL
eukprot:4609575-Pyramimonas_sp.AAC.1